MRGIFVSIFVAIFFFSISSPFFTTQHSLIIAIVSLLVTLWTNEALPLGVVSLLPLILFPSLGLIDLKDLTFNYSKSIIFLFLGGFMLAIALKKTDLHRYISSKLLSIFPDTPRGVIYSLTITSALLSSILSNTTITLMLMPIGLYLSQDRNLTIRFLLAIAYGASIGGIITPIGTPPNMILLGFLEDRSILAPTFGEWIIKVAPIAIVMLTVVPYLLSLKLGSISLQNSQKEQLSLNKDQKRLLFILGALSLLLILNTPIRPYYGGLGLNEKLILLGFGLLMFIPKFGFLEWEDTKEIPYEIILLFGAGFSIATVFSKSGLALDIAQKISFVSSYPQFFILIFISLFVAFSTEITSNTALTSIALPVFYQFSKDMGDFSTVVMMVATISASYAFMLPIATPPNAIIMSSKVIEVKDMAKFGFFINILGILTVSIIAYLFWT